MHSPKFPNIQMVLLPAVKCRHHWLCIHLESQVIWKLKVTNWLTLMQRWLLKTIHLIWPAFYTCGGNTSQQASLHLKAQHKGTILQQWQADWSQSPHFDKISQIDSMLPNRKTYKMLSSFPWHATSVIVQLWTGHISLNLILKKIKAVESYLCKCCCKIKMLVHYLNTARGLQHSDKD